MAPRLRPMETRDAEDVLRLMNDAFVDLDRRMGLPATPPPHDARGLVRICHMITTDPGGAWVSVDAGGTVTGAALAILREGLWGLSLLCVHPSEQSSGAGSALLRAALEYGENARGGLIFASEDARALRVYHRAGFALRPVIDAHGPVRRRPDVPPAVRAGRWPADREAIDAAGRAARGAAHGDDLRAMLAAGNALSVHERGGFAIHDQGHVRLLAAHDDGAARDLLRAALAATPAGKDATVTFIAAGHDWAVAELLEAGLTLRPGGAIFARGEVGPLRPYLSGGAYT
jgi:GNAT superfamily N-acetyltransferase